MKYRIVKWSLVVLTACVINLTADALLDTVVAQEPDTFTLANGSIQGGGIATGGDYVLRTGIGYGSGGVTSSGGEFTLTSGGAGSTDPEPEPNRDHVIFLPMVKR